MHNKLVIGNSSSGLIEVPTLGIPTVNIGDWQKGKKIEDTYLVDAIRRTLSMSFSGWLPDT